MARYTGNGSDSEFPVKLAAKIVGGVVAAIFGLCLFFGSWYTVDQGDQGVVTRFGAVSSVTGPGLHFKVPFIDDVKEVGTRTSYLEWHNLGKEGDSRMESYSRDQQPAHLSVKVVFNVKADSKSVTDLYTRFGTLLSYQNSVIIPRTLEAVKTVFGTYNAVRVIQERAAFNVDVENALHKLIPDSDPVLITALQIQDITFSGEYEKAVEARMQAQVEVEKITQNLERERKQAEIKVVQAEANAKAVRLAGESEADAIRARSNALKDSPRLVDLTLAEKWNGVLPTTMVPGSSVPFISVK